MSLPPPPQPVPLPQPSPGPFPPGMASYWATGPRLLALRGLRTALSVLLVLVILGCLGSAATWAGRATTGERFLDGRSSYVDLEYDTDAIIGVAFLFGVGVIATAVVFVIWQFRYVRNARVLGTQVRLGPGWAIGGWLLFLPLWIVVNLVLPAGRSWATVTWVWPFLLLAPAVSQLQQASRSSDPAPTPGQGPTPARTGRLVTAWGLVVGGAVGLSWVAVAYVDPVPEPNTFGAVRVWAGDAVDADRMVAVGFLGLAVAAGLAIAMVQALTNGQDHRIRAIAFQPQPAPFPPQPAGPVPFPADGLPPAPAELPLPVAAVAASAAGLPLPFAVPVPQAAVASGRRRRAPVALAVAGAMVVGFVALGVHLGARGDGIGGPRWATGRSSSSVEASSTGGEVSVRELAVGDCFDQEGFPSASSGPITRVDCDEAHAGEIFAVEDLAGSDFPGDSELAAQADEVCLPAFEDYVGTLYVDSDWYYGWYGPTEESWERFGDRRLVCDLFDPQGEVTGSKEGTGT